MKANAAGTKDKRKIAPKPPVRAVPGARIHPVVIYPYRQPDDLADLEQLFDLVGWLDSEKGLYARPITVIDRKTHLANAANPRYLAFRDEVVARRSEIVDAWCVDTCQMWYSGMGLAHERGGSDDVYWLIPGDFNYATPAGHEVLAKLHDLPEICIDLKQDVCIGEITTDHNNSKQLIDNYGTFALLYNWFPVEAQEIRQYTERPRSEFFAIRHAFLGEVLRRRWYAYEQTLVILLHAVSGDKRMSRFNVGAISDLPEGRDSLESAIQQVERAERVLKSLWRERHHGDERWVERYRALEAQSEEIRRTAVGILGNILR
ncbi:MAG: hypothetical protein DVB31_04830 [Verrucomicrobia bacterium]|nr:MAG: hypothetical protein DVB31_04830 [Verrucomicrobiota bacterium]